MRIAVDHRHTILNAAARLFARKPFHEVLMDDIAEAASIAKGTIYRFFPNKDELFAALALHYMEVLAEGMRETATGDQPPLVRLERTLEELVRLYRVHTDFFLVMQRHEAELWSRWSTPFRDSRNGIRDVVAGLFIEAEREGAIRCRFEPPLLADMAMGMIRNLMRFSLPEGEPRALARMTVDLCVNGLQADAPAGMAAPALCKAEGGAA